MSENSLPNRANSIVPEAKIRLYLLNVEHPHGGSKAKYFLAFGYTPEKWQQFAAALKLHANVHPVVGIEQATFGKRYIIEGTIETPDGRNPHIRVIWFIDDEDENQYPRLVTAYPLK